MQPSDLMLLKYSSSDLSFVSIATGLSHLCMALVGLSGLKISENKSMTSTLKVGREDKCSVKGVA
jgi:hypothetical protein